MASKNGQITFYFDTLPELQQQLWEALGPMALMMGKPGTVQTKAALYAEHMKNAQQAPDPSSGFVYPMRNDNAGATTPGPQQAPIEPTIKQVEEQREISKENAEAIRTAESINAEVRQANKEAAASMIQAEIEAHIGPKIAAAVSLEGSDKKPDTPVEGAPAADVTLDTLTTVDYPVLLAFCDQHPEVGVVTEKCKPTFFRKLVECKVKTYLETK